MEEFAPVLVTATIFYFVAYIVRLSYEHKIRLKLLEKGLSEEQTKALNFTGFTSGSPASLKWGIVSTALGAGLFLRIILNRMIDIELRDEFTLGLMLLLAGLSLIVYYFIDKKLNNQNEER